MSNQLLEQIHALTARWRGSAGTGGAIAVVERGSTIVRDTFGLADLEHCVPFTPDTPFHICSLTKQFTACVLLMLDRDGAVDLDRDLRAYLPELPDYGAIVTARHLLTNTSGLPDYLALPGIADGTAANPLTEEIAVALVLSQSQPMFEPGSRYNYSNTNFLLAGRLIERLTRTPLTEVFHDCLFAPLGMTATRFLPRTRPAPPGAAVGYVQGPVGLTAPRLDIYEAGDGGVWSTLDDLARWEAHWHARTLGAELLQRMTSPPRLRGGIESWYAYGLGTGTFRGQRWSGHSGGLSGMSLNRVYFPDVALSVVIAANGPGSEPEAMCLEVAATRLPAAPPGPPVPAPDTGTWALRVGVYSHAEGAQVLTVAPPQPPAQAVTVRWQTVDVRMTGEVDGTLRDASGMWRLRPADDGGDALALSTRNGPWLRFEHCPAATPPVPGDLDGTWHCAALASRWIIRCDATKVRLTIHGPRARTEGLGLRPLALDLYAVTRPDGSDSGITAQFARHAGRPHRLSVSVPSSAGHEFRPIEGAP